MRTSLSFVALCIATTLAIAAASSVSGRVAGGSFVPVDRKSYTYEQYVRDYKKTGRDEKEHAMRREIFNRELEIVLEINADKKNTYKAGINTFSDMTENEKAAYRNVNYNEISYHTKLEGKVKPKRIHTAASDEPVPEQIDWSKAVPARLTAVKDQGQCGSCWSFSSTETAESHYAIATGELHDLAVGQTCGCAPNPKHCGGTGGCAGSTAELAFDWMSKTGITSEWQEGYKSYYGKTQQCVLTTPKQKVAFFDGYVQVTRNSGASTMDALRSGPLSIVVAASEWYRYHSGIYNGCHYSKNITLDHVVQLVGYGEEDGQNYYKIRNSWAPSFGEQGFIRLARAATPAKEKCGLNVDTSQGVACGPPFPPTEHVCGECGLLYDVTFPIPKPPTN